MEIRGRVSRKANLYDHDEDPTDHGLLGKHYTNGAHNRKGGNITKYTPRYSGPNCSGICVCGCSWEDHHLGVVLNEAYIEETGEYFIPEECETYGFNETGGLDKQGREHCSWYRDNKGTAVKSSN